MKTLEKNSDVADVHQAADARHCCIAKNAPWSVFIANTPLWHGFIAKTSLRHSCNAKTAPWPSFNAKSALRHGFIAKTAL